MRAYSAARLGELRRLPKRVINPASHWSDKPGHRQRVFNVVGIEDETVIFRVYLRENTRDEQDFSCGIVFRPSGSAPLTLARFNGPSHRHHDIIYHPHIHQATEEAIAAGRKPESQAERTDRFAALPEALGCLAEDYTVSGVPAFPML